MTVLRTIIGRRRILAAIVAVAMGVGAVPAIAEIGMQGGSYLGTSEPTGYKPQSKLWYHDGLWWGVLFNPVSADFEIYKYDRNVWSWTTTGVMVENRPTAKVDALMDGTKLYVAAALPASVGGDKASYVHRFSYNGGSHTFVRESSSGKVLLENTAVEEIVLAMDTAGVLWANWIDGGAVYVTHSAGGSHTSWVTAYPLVSGLVSGSTGDSASIVAFGTKIGVMWSNSTTTGGDGFNFAVHENGTADRVNADPLLSDWTFEAALGGINQADDHINLKALSTGEVLAAVKHNHALGTDAQISVLKRAVGGTWSQHVVWLNADNTTRPIIEVDTTAGRAHVFSTGMFTGTIYRKDALLSDLVFPSGLGSSFIALSTDQGLNNATSTKQSVNSATGLLVMAGDDGTHRYGFNYLNLGGPATAIVPAWPIGVTAVGGNASAVVSWSPPGNDGGSAITGYTVTPYLNGVAQAPRVFNNMTATTQTVVGLAIGTTYTFRVAAINAKGTGPVSAPSAPTATMSAPGAPTGVSAVPGNSSALVSWVPPASNGGSAITGYTVTSSPGGFTATAAGTTTSAVVSGLTLGTSYTFTVKATSIVGTGPASAPSPPVVPTAVPGAPTGVTAVAGTTSATVSWNPPASSGGSVITGYTLTWAVNGIDQSTRTFTSTATTQTITGLASGTTYTFRVAAINAIGTGLASTPSAPVTTVSVAGVVVSKPDGYWMVGSDGAVYAFGASRHLGNAVLSGGAQAVDLEPTPSGNGYWIVDDAGHVFTLGDAGYHGNADPSKLVVGEKVTSLSATPSGNGYWIFTSKGRVLPKGDAVFVGDVSAINLNGPVLDSIPTPSGQGYYMVASDGGIFTFGDAVFHGSTGDIKLNAPVQSLVPNPVGGGYWLVASDGGVFTFGNVPFMGSMGGTRLNKPMTGMVPYGNGYLMVAEDGGIFNFSDKGFLGSLGNNPPARPIVSVASIV